MTNKEQWPEGATHKIDGEYTKWVEGTEYVLERQGGRQTIPLGLLMHIWKIV